MAGVHKEDIKAGLRKKFGTLGAFERKQNLPTGSVRDILRGRASTRTEKAISEAVNRPLHELFPLRYPAPEGESSTNVDNSAAKRETHRQIARAE